MLKQTKNTVICLCISPGVYSKGKKNPAKYLKMKQNKTTVDP